MPRGSSRWSIDESLAPLSLVHTRAEFREKLNEESGGRPDDGGERSSKGVGGRYSNRKRAYGDYLRHQDRWLFELSYVDYLKELAAKEKQK